MSKRTYDVDVYKDKAGEFRWRLVAPNGKIIADGGEGYSTRASAVRAAKRLSVVFVGYEMVLRAV
jgi:uncharacterized protein YegP (UPF0339 family)